MGHVPEQHLIYVLRVRAAISMPQRFADGKLTRNRFVRSSAAPKRSVSRARGPNSRCWPIPTARTHGDDDVCSRVH